ncbi:MAG TPA: NAD(P) transhydrogenase subunit alpha [Tepidisphaeraceae bacterium]|nr:NAD(P) transhydrogenase subunit alpha [Tepidisphaeraceae bacterium]
MHELTFTSFTGDIYVFILAAFLGLEVIKRVSPLLHTPLMSLTNAISAISVIAAIELAGEKQTTLSTVLGTLAVASASANIIGGFMITDRMLKMFKKREVRP